MLGSVSSDKRPNIRFLGHATNSIELDGVRILTDPVVRNRVTILDRVVAPLAEPDYSGHDVVLISHLHYDHCDVPSIELANAPVVIVPSDAGEYLYRKGVQNLVELEVGASVEYLDVVITAVPALHDGSRLHGRIKADAIGYVITGRSGSVYFAGDTDVFDDMAAVRQIANGSLDVALLPVWGWGPNLGPGHMNPERAVEALGLLTPEAAMPIHWGTFYPRGLRRALPQRRWVLEQPPLEFAERAKRDGFDDTVLVTQPGARLVRRR